MATANLPQNMAPSNLVIVESPAKAKTIEKFLGKDFEVKSSFGHIRDLPKKGMSIDIENGFTPTYEVNTDKKKTVTELKKAAKGKTVWLASDEDREGEAIAWHLTQALGLDAKTTKRIVFHEITKPAILKAIENPRTVNQPLVDAQQARRILDRLVGYELSPVLWKKIKAGLSAGRVQSVAVRVIVEREREIKEFESSSTFKVTAEFNLEGNVILKADCPTRFKTYEEAETFLEGLKSANFTIESLETKPGKKSPAAPFTTSTLQQEASRKLSFSVKQTMMVAQRLYEAGKITYMRTDSVNLSETAVEQASNVITTDYGKEYLQTRKFKTKSSGAQEAHEAIRPTDFSEKLIDGERNQQRLYDLIWKRAIASQMAEAKIEKTIATIVPLDKGDAGGSEIFKATGEVLKFDGFLKVYLEGKDDEDDEETGVLPPLNEGQVLDLKQIVGKEMFARPKPRYTEASLVKALEEMGIGRPSTYAPTISTIQDRGYIEKKDRDPDQRQARVLTLKDTTVKIDEITENYGAEKNKLFPTEIGKVVNDFLVKFFPDVVDFQFTARVEAEFDEIAEGKRAWNAVIQDFYGGFHETVISAADISRAEASQQRELGKDPKTGKPVIARIGRFGPMVQIGTVEDEEKPQFASIPEGTTTEDVTLEEALKMFEFPRLLGKTEDGEEILVNTGRFGPYVKAGKTNASLARPKKDEEGNSIPGDDPFSITLNRALELITEKKEKDKNKFVQVWEEEDVQLLRGPYGVYIKHAKKNFRIPKDIEDPTKLTLEQCQEIIKNQPASKGRRKAKK